MGLVVTVLVFASLVLGFERAMGNAFTGKLMSDFRFDLFLIDSHFHDYMSGQGVFRCGKRPYVDVVDVRDSRNGNEFFFDFGNIQFRRHSVEIHAHGFFQETHNTSYHNDRDDNRDDRIDHDVSGEIDNRPSDNHAEGYESIPEKMQIRRLNIDVLLGSFHKKESRQTVHDNPDGRNDHHGRSDGFHGLRYPIYRLDDDKRCRSYEKYRVHQCGEHAGSPVSVCKCFSALKSGCPNGDSRYYETEYVHGVVSGVGKKGERMDPESEECLYGNEDDIDGYGAEKGE